MEININVTEEKDTFEYAMWKSANAFKKKRAKLNEQFSKKSKSRVSKTESLAEKSQRLKRNLAHVPNIDQADPSNYIFSDSDNNDAGNENEGRSKRKMKKSIKFDAREERKNALESK